MMIRTAALQLHVKPGDTVENFNKAAGCIREAAAKGADLIVLPELPITGYGLTEENYHSLAEAFSGSLITSFQELARELQTVLVVPFAEKYESRLFISAAIIERTGSLLSVYRKSFLWGNEKRIFSSGKKCYKPVETSLGKIGILICADAEFPEPSRLLALQGADLIVVPSVWSLEAESRWDIQLPARALDNTVFVMGVNTVHEGSCGKSKFVRPDGAVLKEAPRDGESLLIEDLDFTIIKNIRKAVPYLQDLPASFYNFPLIENNPEN
ncbi:nitrilase [Alkalicoccus saliphilus]|uniref:Nitrilase n=2 Tax=Alkalicoccus saliphilus TaxID=200989 RepID=A0A2T4UAB2_9BACI|nr:nitrilase [Alkalicoccus saliphilus]